MTTFSFNLNDNKHDAIVDAWCAVEGYQAMIDNGQGIGVMIANPETKLQFAKRTVKRKMQDAYVRYNADMARIAAAAAAEGEV
jgi:DNA polymerase III epsilon subunit-like protein